MNSISTLRASVKNLAAEKRGAVALIFAIAVALLAALVVSVLDFGNVATTRARLQSAADSAALATARELLLSNPNAAQLAQVAKNAARANLGPRDAQANVKASVIDANSAVSVTISKSALSSFGRISLVQNQQVTATAVAKLVAASSLCMLALSTTEPMALGLDSASVTAPSCAAMSNSTTPDSISATGSATLAAIGICSGGGVAGAPSALTPWPQRDCPTTQDPLGARAPPNVSGCDYTNVAFSGGSQTLTPGTYCGGITASNYANITMANGIYVIKDGTFTLSTGAQLTTTNAAVYLTGAGAVLNFDDTTALNLTAPASGPLSGMLFFEDRTAPLGQVHLISSRQAAQLLGTVYLPRGKLIVGQLPTSGPVAYDCMATAVIPPQCPPTPASIGALSSWTIVVANQIAVNAGVNIVLNANYAQSSVPAPPEIVTLRPRLVR